MKARKWFNDLIYLFEREPFKKIWGTDIDQGKDTAWLLNFNQDRENNGNQHPARDD